jgi:hypothetical protein
MTRNRFLARAAALVAGIAAASSPLMGKKSVLAGKGWCRMDPLFRINGQLVDVYGSVWTEPQYITNATFTVTVKSGTTVELIGTPDCPTTILHNMGFNHIVFNFGTNNGDHLGRFEVIPIDSGPIGAVDVQFTGYSYTWNF